MSHLPRVLTQYRPGEADLEAAPGERGRHCVERGDPAVRVDSRAPAQVIGP